MSTMTSTHPVSETTRPRRGTILQLLPEMAGHGGVFAWTLVSGLFAQLSQLGLMGLEAGLVGLVLTRQNPAWAPAMIGLAAGVLLTAAGRWGQLGFAHDFAFAMIEKIQIGIYDGISRAAPRSLLGRRAGELTSVATSDADHTEKFYAHLLGDYLGAGLVPLGVLALLTWLQPLLAAILLPFLLLLASVPLWLARRAGEQGQALRIELATLHAEVVEGIQGIKELLSFGQGRAYTEKLRQRTRGLHRQQRRYGARAGLEQAAIDLLLSLATLSILLAGMQLVLTHQMSLAQYPVAIVLVAVILAPVATASQSARQLGELDASAERILTVLHQPAHIDDLGTATALGVPELRFDQVRFGYAADRPVLEGLDFTVAPGETVALVGASGAGKSTCIQLLMRFWEAESGQVRIGGQDIRALRVSCLRRQLALVPQDVYLFNLSIADNIRLGRPKASLAEVKAAARQAQAADFIAALPEGYDTLCGERGLRLSGGQRQRIAIARAFLQQAPILLMDEAVSHLDGENERALQQTLQHLRQGRTTLLVAHRLSTIRSADRILVLDQGRIAESGSHDALMARQGVYARLVASALTGARPIGADAGSGFEAN